jgi:hypothetical protein
MLAYDVFWSHGGMHNIVNTPAHDVLGCLLQSQLTPMDAAGALPSPKKEEMQELLQLGLTVRAPSYGSSACTQLGLTVGAPS